MTVDDIETGISALLKDLGLDAIPEKTCSLSIVIPAYNERERLPRTVLNTIEWCHRNAPSAEILIVDDGSSDDTFELACLFSRRFQNVFPIACPHFGKGSAVRSGMINTRGKYVLFMDADGATPLDEIPKLISKIDDGYHGAIGSRAIKGEDTNVQMTPFRKIVGRVFSTLVGFLAVSGYKDTQCGFKMFRNDVAKKLFYLQKLNGFAFDVEILFLANRFNYRIAEIPVNWRDQKGSKVNVYSDSLRMFRDIIKIRALHLFDR